MALKDWKRIGAGHWRNVLRDDETEISYFTLSKSMKPSWNVIITRRGGAEKVNLRTDNFSAAHRKANSYMRTH